MNEVYHCDGCGDVRYQLPDLHWVHERCRACSRARSRANFCGQCYARYRAGKLAPPRVSELSAEACRCDAAVRAAKKARRRG